MIGKFSRIISVLGSIVFIFAGACSQITASDIDGSGDMTDLSDGKAIYVRTDYEGNTVDGEFGIIDNYNDLIKLLNDDTPEKYDNAFFKNNSLIVFKNVETSSGNRSIIDSYDIENEIITINVKTVEYGEICVMSCWWFILELDKNEVADIETVKIIKNGKEISHSY